MGARETAFAHAIKNQPVGDEQKEGETTPIQRIPAHALSYMLPRWPPRAPPGSRPFMCWAQTLKKEVAMPVDAENSISRIPRWTACGDSQSHAGQITAANRAKQVLHSARNDAAGRPRCAGRRLQTAAKLANMQRKQLQPARQ